jgi:hypothetical protein
MFSQVQPRMELEVEEDVGGEKKDKLWSPLPRRSLHSIFVALSLVRPWRFVANTHRTKPNSAASHTMARPRKEIGQDDSLENRQALGDGHANQYPRSRTTRG